SSATARILMVRCPPAVIQSRVAFSTPKAPLGQPFQTLISPEGTPLLRARLFDGEGPGSEEVPPPEGELLAGGSALRSPAAESTTQIFLPAGPTCSDTVDRGGRRQG